MPFGEGALACNGRVVVLICGKEAREGLRYHMTTSIITLSKTTTLCWFTNRPKCEHTLEQSYSGMYSIYQHIEQNVRMNTDGLEQLLRTRVKDTLVMSKEES